MDLSLDKFASFPQDRIDALKIAHADRRLLKEIGLPATASPFLTFRLGAEWALLPIEELPNSIAIGQNGCGDLICIDQLASGAIVYYNHDNNMERVFINSTLLQFAECLCLFAEFLRDKNAERFRQQVDQVDPDALLPNAFWLSEFQSSLDD